MKAAARASATLTPTRHSAPDNYLGMRPGFLSSTPCPAVSASAGQPKASTVVASDTAVTATGPAAGQASRPRDTYMGLRPGFLTSPGSQLSQQPIPTPAPPALRPSPVTDASVLGRVVDPRVLPSLTDRDAIRKWFGRGVVDRLVELGKRNAAAMRTCELLPDGFWLGENLCRIAFEQAGLRASLTVRQGVVNTHYFDRFDHCSYRLKAGMSASQGLDALFEGLTVVDCTGTLMAVYYAQVRAALGDARFDNLFGSGTGTPTPESRRMRVDLEGLMQANPLGFFLTHTLFAKMGEGGQPNHRPVDIGDWVNFLGAHLYNTKHPAGAAYSWNVVYAGRDSQGRQTYQSLGMRQTEDEIVAYLIDAHNQPRTSADEFFARQNPKKYDMTAPGMADTVHALGSTGGYCAGTLVSFDVDRIIAGARGKNLLPALEAYLTQRMKDEANGLIGTAEDILGHR